MGIAEPTSVQLAWAAGVFEGEGCITHGSKDALWNFRVVLIMNDKDVVERFAAIFGGNVTARKPPRYKLNWNTSWAWSATGIRASRLLEQLLPYFGERRSERATEAVVAFAEQHAKATQARTCPGCGRDFSPVWSHMAMRKVFCSKTCSLKTWKRANQWA